MNVPWMQVGHDRSSVKIDVAKMNALADAYTHGVNTSDTAFVACAVRYAIAAEREACAKLVESGNVADTRSRNLIDHLARSIRDRSNYV